MVCDPSSNDIGVSGIPAIPLPGFGIPFSPITVPAPGFELPGGFPESILDLLNQAKVSWPGFGEVIPNLDDLSNTLLKALATVFNEIAPFLGLYNFFMALLNMILCIIEVLCALPNPFSTVRAVIRLIKNCLPPFLNLFPWLALLAMILSLILLIIALVLYIISRVIQFIEDLIRNLQILVDGLSFQDGESTAAAVVKIASLLCLFENLVAMFASIAAIIAIIEALASLAGRTVCAGSGSGQGDDSQCCTDDVCPPFIIENPNGIQGSQGRLIYQRPVRDPGTNFLSTPFIREESWQFYNDDGYQSINEQFRQIITRQKGPTDYYGNAGFEYGDIFWPEGQVFSKDTSLRRAPYVLDLLLEDFNPKPFIDSDNSGPRDFIIRNVIVNTKPYYGINGFNNQTQFINSTGTFKLVGGEVFEFDSEGNEFPYLVGNSQASIENFIRLNLSTSEPTFDDGYNIENITFNLKINHAALIYYDLIVYGCIPQVRQELDLANLVNGDVSAILARINPIFPDLNKAQTCISTALEKFRSNITVDTAQEFQADFLACTDELLAESNDIYCKVFIEAVDPFNSSFEIIPDVEFVGRPIRVEITLRDRNRIDITQNVPEGCVEQVANKLKVNADFGEVSELMYDSSVSRFVVIITSDIGGIGQANVSFNGNVLSEVKNSDTLSEPTAIENTFKQYEFVGTETDGKNRRDAGDVARI